MYSWIPIYKELSRKLLDYRDKQAELLTLLRELEQADLPMINLRDKGPRGANKPLTEIDPFTFFATFNRKTRDDNRIAILNRYREYFNLSSPAPDDFSGIPIMDPRKSWFLPWESERDPGDVPALWDFAHAIVTMVPSAIPDTLFNRCLQIHCVSATNLTMGMFWMQPEVYLPLDSRTRSLLDERGINHDAADWKDYLQFNEPTIKRLSAKPYEVSYTAYAGTTSKAPEQTRYWIFQCNPEKYDVIGALEANALRSWKVSQHKADIAPGDKAIIWGTGKMSACVALATITSKPTLMPEDMAERSFWSEAADSEPANRVRLDIDYNFADNPIPKATLQHHQAFHDFPAGRQGTNLPATLNHYDALLEIRRDNTRVRYWVYAPGRNGSLWEYCWDSGEMVYGADELPALDKFANKSEIEQAFKRESKSKNRPTNHALAAWEFCRVLKPGDIVIAKQGRDKYVGYGVVTGPYRHDATRSTFRNLRSVRWIKRGEWPEVKHPIVLKTLTDITKYPDYVERLKVLLEMNTNEWKTSRALNTILYGPPGTGKTYSTIRRAVEIVEDTVPENEGEIKKRFDSLLSNKRIGFITFHQTFCYEDFVEGIRPVLDDQQSSSPRYTCRDGIFKQICEEARKNAHLSNYVLIIDEINRGNISKIFGELITLLEEDKREGAKHALTTTLPYSQKPFSVPGNLFILGTMNTADKSIALVDVALRRRFRFDELMPDYRLVPEFCRDLLKQLNRRIVLRKDRDHLIGHSYFMGLPDEKAFDAVFKNSIQPLLQEYFFNDWEGLRFVLGEDKSDCKAGFIRKLDTGDLKHARNQWQWYHDADDDDVKPFDQLKHNYGIAND